MADGDTPTIDFVTGVRNSGVGDPVQFATEYVASRGWSKPKGDKWAKSFLAHDKFLDERAEQTRKAQEPLRSGARALSEFLPPIARDVAVGVARTSIKGVSALTRVGSALGLNDPGLPDAANRLAQQLGQMRALAAKSDEVPDFLQDIVSSSAESLSLALPLVATGGGFPVLVGGFMASKANQSITEAVDARLPDREKWGFVGRATAIEGLITSAFQVVGAGGLEKMLLGGKVGVAEFFKQAGFELAEESITELLDAANSVLSGVSEPLDGEQTLNLLAHTWGSTLLSLGFAGGFNNSEQIAEGLAKRMNWAVEKAKRIVKSATKKGPGEFHVALGREMERARQLEPEQLAELALSNPDAALDYIEANGSRTGQQRAGLPDAPKEEREQGVGVVRATLASMTPQERVTFAEGVTTVAEAAQEAAARAAAEGASSQARRATDVATEAAPAVEAPTPEVASTDAPRITVTPREPAVATPPTEERTGPFAGVEPLAEGATPTADQRAAIEALKSQVAQERFAQTPAEAAEAGEVALAAPKADDRKLGAPFPARVKEDLTPVPPVGTSPEYSSEFTAMKNSATAQDRRDLKIAGHHSPEVKSHAEMIQEAKDKKVPERAMEIAGEFLRGGRILQDFEIAGLNFHQVELKNTARDLLDKKDETADEAERDDLDKRLRLVQDDVNRLTLAVQRTGTSAARSLAARNIGLDRAFDQVSILDEAFRAKKSDLTDKERTFFIDEAKRLRAWEKKLRKLEAKNERELVDSALNKHRAAHKNGRPKTPRKTFTDTLARAKELIAQGC